MDKNETGKDGVLIVNGREIPFTNADYEISFDTTGSDFNDQLEQDSAITSKPPVEVNIEADGSKAELKGELLTDDGMPRTDLRAIVRGSEVGDRFSKGKPTAFGREFPGGDKTTTSVTIQFDRHRPIR